MFFVLFLCHFILFFFDDILIYSKTWVDHLTHVDQVLSLPSQHQIFLNKSKCAFGASEVEYLCHIFGKDGVRVDPKKIEAMHDWSCPKTLKILCGFMGSTRYYHKFVQNYGNIAAPLTALLKKNYFTWTPTVDQSFQALKEAMCTILVLALHEFTNIFFLKCDSFGKGIGAILMQEGRPFDFTKKNSWSKILANKSMTRKCWLFCMLWISDILVSWGNDSKLKPTIRASSIS
jgi:hypothetical protein